MSDQVFLQFLIYAIVVGGAWYHGWKQGIDAGAGKMYDYLFFSKALIIKSEHSFSLNPPKNS